MELIKDRLRQDDLPLSCVFSAKANFQLGTPHTQGANRPSHSVCDFPITEALLDKGGDQCWICLALSHVAPLGSVVTGSPCPAPCLIPAYLPEKTSVTIYRKLYGLLKRLNEMAMEPRRLSFEVSIFVRRDRPQPLGR